MDHLVFLFSCFNVFSPRQLITTGIGSQAAFQTVPAYHDLSFAVNVFFQCVSGEITLQFSSISSAAVFSCVAGNRDMSQLP